MVAFDYRLAHGFRSGLEERVSEQLAFLNILDCYEIKKIPFVQPAKNRNYTPDFWLPNGIIVCLLYTSPSPRDVEESRMPSSA